MMCFPSKRRLFSSSSLKKLLVTPSFVSMPDVSAFTSTTRPQPRTFNNIICKSHFTIPSKLILFLLCLVSFQLYSKAFLELSTTSVLARQQDLIHSSICYLLTTKYNGRFYSASCLGLKLRQVLSAHLKTSFLSMLISFIEGSRQSPQRYLPVKQLPCTKYSQFLQTFSIINKIHSIIKNTEDAGAEEQVPTPSALICRPSLVNLLLLL